MAYNFNFCDFVRVLAHFVLWNEHSRSGLRNQGPELDQNTRLLLPDLFSIEKTIEAIITNTKEEVADTPRNPQCLLMKWSDYIRYIDTGMVLPDRQLDDLIYLVTVDVTRKPWEAPSRSLGGLINPEAAVNDPALVERFTSHQDVYIFDAKTGETLGFGYTPYVMILPKP